jgi:hypothetical protein
VVIYSSLSSRLSSGSSSEIFVTFWNRSLVCLLGCHLSSNIVITCLVIYSSLSSELASEKIVTWYCHQGFLDCCQLMMSCNCELGFLSLEVVIWCHLGPTIPVFTLVLTLDFLLICHLGLLSPNLMLSSVITGNSCWPTRLLYVIFVTWYCHLGCSLGCHL